MSANDGIGSRPEFAARQRELLALEQQAERAASERLARERSDAELVARGTTLLRLEVRDLLPGIGGALQAVLASSRDATLPAHRLGPGDLVALRQNRDGEPAATGVVARVRRDSLTITLDDEDAELPTLVRLDRLASDVTWQRLRGAIDEFERDPDTERRRLVEVLCGERAPEVGRLGEPTFFDDALDDSQRAAITHALAAEQVALLHGPPGTGKTTAVVEFVRQVIARGDRVLACAPSNVAVDNLAERLAAAGVRIVRLGHPARVSDRVIRATLAAQIDDAPEQKLLKTVRREVEQGLRAVHRATNRRDRAAARNEVRARRRELRQLESAITRGIVDGAEVVLATTTGAADRLLQTTVFDQLVIDEAAQALEAACWIPLTRTRRVLLAGDHRQLGPTILSDRAERGGLGTTLFERLIDSEHRETFARQLTMQYRMHQAIMSWPAHRFYGDTLRAAPAVAEHQLTDLPDVAAGEWTVTPLRFLDTAGCGHEETPGDDDGSKANPGEVALVRHVVAELLDAGVAADAIAVLTPYNAQVQLLRRALPEKIEIGTVDALQGREKEATVVSLVRSNENGEVGFLRELRRLNVALTRARRHLTVIGDSATLANDPDLLGLVEHLQRHADYRSAFEFDVSGA
ncbi:MAG: AAA domain-containing protein [bacterium]|nr:AAA domain-containing protein [bacterium]